MSFKHLLIFISAAFLVIGCGEINRPYKSQTVAEKLSNSLILPQDAYGITLEPLSGVDPYQNDVMGNALIAAVESYNIPISPYKASGQSYKFRGQLVTTTRQHSLIWQLLDHNNQTLTDGELSAAIDYAATPTLEITEQFARQAAQKIALTLKPDILDALSKQQILENMSIKILQIVGAPGDGNASLARNIKAILKRAKIKIAKQDERADVVISGAILIKNHDANQQMVRLDWLLQDHQGRELQSLKQQNLVPNGQLDGRWGDIAYAIAVGVVQEAAFALDKVALRSNTAQSQE